jgi:arginase
MKVRVITVPYDSGQRGQRMGRGPISFLEHGILDTIAASGHTVQHVNVKSDEAYPLEVGTAIAVNALLADQVQQANAEGAFPLVLAGNCNSCLGTLAGIEDVGIIWFDTHGDFNTPDTTGSGFFDGMALATAAGLCWRSLVARISGFHAMPTEHMLHIGGRDFDPEEDTLMDKMGIIRIHPDSIHRAGVEAALSDAVNVLRTKVERVYIHLDLDVLDGDRLRANGFSYPGGLQVEQVEDTLRFISKQFTIAAAALTAYDPTHDPDAQIIEAGKRLIAAML